MRRQSPLLIWNVLLFTQSSDLPLLQWILQLSEILNPPRELAEVAIQLPCNDPSSKQQSRVLKEAPRLFDDMKGGVEHSRVIKKMTSLMLQKLRHSREIIPAKAGIVTALAVGCKTTIRIAMNMVGSSGALAQHRYAEEAPATAIREEDHKKPVDWLDPVLQPARWMAVNQPVRSFGQRKSVFWAPVQPLQGCEVDHKGERESVRLVIVMDRRMREEIVVLRSERVLSKRRSCGACNESIGLFESS